MANVAEMATEACSKCGQEPRAGKSVWGRTCLAAKKRDLRQRKAQPVSQAETPETRLSSTPVPRESHAECRKRIEQLEDEVARLKRTLAARPPLDAVGIPVGANVGKVSLRPSVSSRASENLALGYRQVTRVASTWLKKV